MKKFSIFSIIASTLLIGYFFIVGLPKIASTGDIVSKKPLQGVETTKNEVATKMIEKKEPSLALRDKCNTLAETKTFESGVAADSFIESCLNGEVVLPSSTNQTEATSLQNNTVRRDTAAVAQTNTIVPVTNADRKQRCNDFMSHAKFDSQASADKFLKNCLAGK